MTCERCGSINIVRSRSSFADKLVRFFTSKKRVTCRRCGWTGRLAWDETDDYVPSAAPLREVEGADRRRKPHGEEDFDINRFH